MVICGHAESSKDLNCPIHRVLTKVKQGNALSLASFHTVRKKVSLRWPSPFAVGISVLVVLRCKMAPNVVLKCGGQLILSVRGS